MNPILQILFALLVVAVVILIAAVCYLMNRPAAEAGERVRFFVRSWKPFDDAELRAALAGWGDTDPRWRALWELLSREVEAELQGLTNVRTDPHELARWAGRLEELLHLRTQLLVFRGKEPRE